MSYLDRYDRDVATSNGDGDHDRLTRSPYSPYLQPATKPRTSLAFFAGMMIGLITAAIVVYVLVDGGLIALTTAK